MADISFLASERRLAVTGTCVRSDADAIVDAIEVFAGLVDPLVVDFTGVAGLPREVAISVIQACRNAERIGHQVAIHAVDEDGAVRLSAGDPAARVRLRAAERC
jgi:hypothetical protein